MCGLDIHINKSVQGLPSYTDRLYPCPCPLCPSFEFAVVQSDPDVFMAMTAVIY